MKLLNHQRSLFTLQFCTITFFLLDGALQETGLLCLDDLYIQRAGETQILGVSPDKEFLKVILSRTLCSVR